MDTKEYLINIGFHKKRAENLQPEIDRLSIDLNNNFAIGFEEARRVLANAVQVGMLEAINL